MRCCSQVVGGGKVALLFLTHGAMHHDQMWKLWFHSAAGVVPADVAAGAACSFNESSLALAREACLPHKQSGRRRDVIARQHLFSVYVHLSAEIHGEWLLAAEDTQAPHPPTRATCSQTNPHAPTSAVFTSHAFTLPCLPRQSNHVCPQLCSRLFLLIVTDIFGFFFTPPFLTLQMVCWGGYGAVTRSSIVWRPNGAPTAWWRLNAICCGRPFATLPIRDLCSSASLTCLSGTPWWVACLSLLHGPKELKKIENIYICIYIFKYT